MSNTQLETDLPL
jgi:hypothetical protein